MYSEYGGHPTKPNGFWGLKLIVCGTIMGRSAVTHRDDNWRKIGEPCEVRIVMLVMIYLNSLYSITTRSSRCMPFT